LIATVLRSCGVLAARVAVAAAIVLDGGVGLLAAGAVGLRAGTAGVRAGVGKSFLLLLAQSAQEPKTGVGGTPPAQK